MAAAVVGVLVEKLRSLVMEDWLKREVSEIEKELRDISSFLRDADARADKDAALKIWIEQVRDVAFDMEDVLDENMLSRSPSSNQPPRRGIIKRHIIKNIVFHHKLGDQISEVRRRLRDISEKRDRYHLRKDEESSSHLQSFSRIWESSSFVKEDELVGTENAKRELIPLLLDAEPRLTTVAVVGMGGLGKTTLVQLVYNSHDAKRHFDCQAWITVSQEFRIQSALQSLTKQLQLGGGGSSVDDLQKMAEKLGAYLHKKSYMIVLDDVWSIDVWEGMRNALPDGRNGSRVLITTRNSEVAKSTYGHVFELQLLTPEESWSLFCKRAFPPDARCPPNLEELSRHIVMRCGGLPLAIAVIGGLLSIKSRRVSEWRYFLDNLRSQMESNPYLRTLHRTLELSYNDLPYHLRSCLLYFSLFPEDVSIRIKRLIRLWTAEEFIRTSTTGGSTTPEEVGTSTTGRSTTPEEVGTSTTGRSTTPEEVAEECLYALVQRSLVQVSELHDDGRLRSCRVPAFIHDMISSIAREQNFAVNSSAKRAGSLHNRVRRISINTEFDDVSQDTKLSHFSGLRSLFLLSGEKRLLERWAIPKFRLLKVLDLEGTILRSFPTGIEDLLLLRYLSLRNTEIKVLPKSLGRLERLETLDLKGTCLSSLPVEIVKLERLRHLLVCHHDMSGGPSIPKGIGKLTSLQTLKCIDVAVEVAVISELGNLTQMRSLCITKKGRVELGQLCSSIEKMIGLLSLKVISVDDSEMIEPDYRSSPPQQLQRLHLKGSLEKWGSLEKLPPWFARAENLVKMRLEGSGLRDDPLRALQNLPHLAVLTLVKAFNGEELCCDDAKGFPKLKVLNLNELYGLKNMKVERGAMPCLQKLRFYKCKRLEKVPKGIKNLSELQELHLIDVPKTLIASIARGEGEDWDTVCSIPVIRYEPNEESQ